MEIDDRYFEIIAQSSTAVLTRHRLTGTFDLWRLLWRNDANFPASFANEAWAAYAKEMGM